MKWLEAAERMDNRIIKKDSTSTDSDYFMATHVPFQSLEFIASGDSSLSSKQLDEESLYRKIFVDQLAHHQMIMVRGTNGTGKSHLICWMHERLIHDTEHYDPEKEKVVFLRRLRNTSRGAIVQMMEAGLVRNPELQEKFQKFVDASTSQDEDEFKANIYHSYITKVATDKTKAFYTPAKCKDIASFLGDSRVQECLMGEGGPISRCYYTIVKGVDPNDGTTKATFEATDFKFSRDISRKIRKSAAEEVQNFYGDELDSGNDVEVCTNLAAYLNHFTSSVIQSCANITSENIRDLFENLRRDLKKEGKRLVILIEDFTSFSIVDSELITALAAEPGGEYHDLCPVTSIIGITDGHYDSFRDNFKDRVFNQISVTENSFSSESFITEMAGRYLNAIYADPAKIKQWYEAGSHPDALPVAEFKPPFSWDSVVINGHEFTLYPFTKKSLLTMFRNLKEKKPRHFLDAAIRQIFRQFADGMETNGWYFPELPPNISAEAMNTIYAASVEQSSFSDDDKRRLKVLLAVWGDGTSIAGQAMIGQIQRPFFTQIGLGTFAGIPISSEEKPTAMGSGTAVNTTTSVEAKAQPEVSSGSTATISKAEQEFNKRAEDIQSWFESGTVLHYSADYFKWISNFVLSGILWQEEGIPAAFVTERQKNGRFVMIEGAEQAISADSVIVYLPKSSETRTVLMGLALFNRFGTWNFEDATYYQYILVTWLEKNKEPIKAKLCGNCICYDVNPVLTWCLAVSYLQKSLCGESLDIASDNQLLKQLFVPCDEANYTDDRGNQSWDNVLTYLKNSKADYHQISLLLKDGANTTMRVLGDAMLPATSFYRYQDLLNSLQHLKQKHWDISDELEFVTGSKQFTRIAAILRDLYIKVNDVVESEKSRAESALRDLDNLLGHTPNTQNIMELSGEIRDYYLQCMQSNRPYRNDLKMRLADDEPKDFSTRVLQCYDNVQEASKEMYLALSLQAFAQNPAGELQVLLRDLHTLEQNADSIKQQCEAVPQTQSSINGFLVQSAQEKLDNILQILEGWEVEE